MTGKFSRFVLVASCLLLPLSGLQSGCANLKKLVDFSDDIDETASPEALAIQGMDAYQVGDYYTAKEAFEKILDSHPFSEQAMLAELKAADCHYFTGGYAEAKVLYQQFEERHPTNEAIPYVMFQIGMSDFSRIDRIDRDISGAQDSIRSFNRLLRAYPDSPYTAEAKARIKAAQEFLVNHEYFVAIFYLRTNKPEQAAHRLKYLLQAHPQAAIAPQAQKLLEKIEAGDPPKMGLHAWLPDLTLPDWMLFGEDATEGKLPPVEKE